MESLDDELENVNKALEAAKKKQQKLMRRRANIQEPPPTWSKTATDQGKVLIELEPNDKQYWAVSDQLR